MKASRAIVLLFLLIAGGSPAIAEEAQPTAQAAPAAPPTPQQRVGMLKQWLQASQAQLRHYEWIETTVVSVKGEEKSRQQNRCYHGAEGKVQKVPVFSRLSWSVMRTRSAPAVFTGRSMLFGKPFIMSVSTGPGSISATATPLPFSWLARFFMTMLRAALLDR